MDEQELLGQVSQGGVFKLTPVDFENGRMTQKGAVAIFNAFDAFWQYEGEPRPERPHALLKSGLHSNGFINCRAVLDYPALCMIFAAEMLKVIEEKISIKDLLALGFVAGSAYSALDLRLCLAWLISQKYSSQVKSVMAEKDKDGNPTIIRGGLDPTLSGLVINELMTTTEGSTWETRKAVLEANGSGKPAPLVLAPAIVLMHRSKSFVLADESPVEAVFHFDIENFPPDVCPYCQAGSQAIKPKLDNNWAILHGQV